MLATVAVEGADSCRFAELSGDFNPIHLDPIAARRLVFGDAVPHGIHLLMLALDSALRSASGTRRLRSVRGTFAASAAHGSPIAIESEEAGSALRLLVRQGRKLLQTITVEFTSATQSPDPSIEHGRFAAEEPRCMSLAEAAGAAERLALRMDPELARAMFPNLMRALPPVQLALLLATTRILGMRCPGLHSVYAALELHFVADDPVAIDYAVRRAEPRLNLLAIELAADGVRGSITALMRQPPTAQPSIAELKPLMRPDEFAGRRALVVGGSRGLGELAAKILATGGAEVWLTYARGAADAAAVVADIERHGGKATAVRLDITELRENEPLPSLPPECRPTHVYLFATPPIRLVRGRAWDDELFASYCRYYVSAIPAVLAGIGTNGGSEPIHLFYPSTAFLDSPPPGAAEYVAAKAAGEALCSSLAASRRDLLIRCPRLPPLKTDQTSGLALPGRSPADALPILLEELRA